MILPPYEGFPSLYLINENIDQYKIIGLISEPYKKDSWNHGRVSGVALNKQTNVIVYWYEFW